MEEEVYSHFVKRASDSEFEMSNNRIQYLIYKTKLLTQSSPSSHVSYNDKKLTLVLKEGLPAVKVFQNDFILDFGSMDSVVSPRVVFNQVPFEKILPIKMKNINISSGDSTETPQVLIAFPIEIDSEKINESQWLLANLKLPFAAGVLGLEFFKDRDFVIYPKKKYIEFTSFENRPSNALFLQKDFDGQVRALEFICPGEELVVRLDSGSQVIGDLKMSTSRKVKEQLKTKKGFRCGKLLISGNFHSDLQNETIFSRGVNLNLGWSWMQKFDKISISLKGAWVSFGNIQSLSK